MFGLTNKTSESETTAKNKYDFDKAKKAAESVYDALEVVIEVNKALIAPKPDNTDGMFMVTSVMSDGVKLTLYFYAGNPEIVYAEKVEAE